jgi:hypothetical protein
MSRRSPRSPGEAELLYFRSSCRVVAPSPTSKRETPGLEDVIRSARMHVHADSSRRRAGAEGCSSRARTSRPFQEGYASFLREAPGQVRRARGQRVPRSRVRRDDILFNAIAKVAVKNTDGSLFSRRRPSATRSSRPRLPGPDRRAQLLAEPVTAALRSSPSTSSQRARPVASGAGGADLARPSSDRQLENLRTEPGRPRARFAILVRKKS